MEEVEVIEECLVKTVWNTEEKEELKAIINEKMSNVINFHLSKGKNYDTI